MTDEQRRMFNALHRAFNREYAKKRRDTICYKCKTQLAEETTVCPKCGTHKRKYSPRTTRKKD